MNIIKKIILFIKKLFIKQDEVKKLSEQKVVIEGDKKESFMESLKITPTRKSSKKKIETLICSGDGLGIQKKITC